jgi:hypothetical protein
MNNRVLVLGFSWYSDLHEIGKFYNIDLETSKKFQYAVVHDLPNLIDVFESYTIVICRFNLHEIEKVLLKFGLVERFMERKYVFVAWTQDSHIFYEEEARCHKYVDFLFVAHSPYVEKIREVMSKSSNSHLALIGDYAKKIAFLPVSYSLTPSQIIPRIKEVENRIKYDVVFPYQIYQGFDRNRISYNFGLFSGHDRNIPIHHSVLINHMMEGKVILNISLKDDLNKRSLETLALNRILLTNNVPDLEILNNNENIFTYKRDLSDFKEVLISSLNQQSINSSDLIYRNHTDSSRLIEMLEYLTKIKYTNIRNIIDTDLHLEHFKSPKRVITYNERSLRISSFNKMSNLKFKEIIHLIPLSRIELKLLYNLMIISIPKAILKILAQLKIKQ